MTRSGLTADEEFDVYPYVEELASRLIAEKDSFTMPEKIQGGDEYQCGYSQLLLHRRPGSAGAPIEDGQRGFRVLIAGSAASNARTGCGGIRLLPEKISIVLPRH